MSKIIKDFDELQEQDFLGYGELYIAVAKIAWQARQPEIDALSKEVIRLQNFVAALCAPPLSDNP